MFIFLFALIFIYLIESLYFVFIVTIRNDSVKFSFINKHKFSSEKIGLTAKIIFLLRVMTAYLLLARFSILSRHKIHFNIKIVYVVTFLQIYWFH